MYVIFIRIYNVLIWPKSLHRAFTSHPSPQEIYLSHVLLATMFYVSSGTLAIRHLGIWSGNNMRPGPVMVLGSAASDSFTVLSSTEQ